MNVEIVAFLLLAVLGVAGVLLGAAYFVFNIVRGVFGSANRLTRPHHTVKPPRRGAHQAMLVCPQAACRHVEHRKALFCSQCGANLSEMKPGENPVAAGRGMP